MKPTACPGQHLAGTGESVARRASPLFAHSGGNQRFQLCPFDK